LKGTRRCYSNETVRVVLIDLVHLKYRKRQEIKAQVALHPSNCVYDYHMGFF